MKHKTIKKSIIFIMITTLLLSCVSSFAATISTENLEINVNNQYIVSPSETFEINGSTGNVYYGVYKFVVQMDLRTFNTGYFNGSLSFLINFPTSGVTVRSVNTYINNTDSIGNDSDFLAIPRYLGPSTLGTRLVMYFNNWYGRTGYQAGPQLNIEVFISQSTNNFSPLAFTFSLSDAAGTLNRTDYPEVGVGLAGVIGMSVLNAINTGDFNDALETLEMIGNTNTSLLNSILDELQESNLNLSDLLYYMQNTQNARLNTIISKIQELIDMGRQDTQAQNELGAAAQQMENAAAAMNVTKPNIAAVIPETLLAADAAQAQSDIFSWLQNGYIIQILIACFTIALIGFVLYGKSG